MAVNTGAQICALETQGLIHGQFDPYPLLACHHFARDHADHLVCYPVSA
jgi:hypothetical protein